MQAANRRVRKSRAKEVHVRIKKRTRGRLFKRKVNGHDTYDNVITQLLNLPGEIRRLMDSVDEGTEDFHKAYEQIEDLVREEANGQ